MIETAKYLCQNIQGSNFAYTQSDEISLLITDFDNINSQMLFDGNIQKIVSVIASMATAKFNFLRAKRGYDSMAQFDGRVFIIPDPIEVFNYFVWRQKDCERNSVSMASRSYFSHKEIKGKNSSQQQDMLMEKGINWNDYDVKFKRGTIIEKEYYKKPKQNEDVYVIRSRWIASNPPVFTQDKNFIWNQIPLYKNKNYE